MLTLHSPLIEPVDFDNYINCYFSSDGTERLSDPGWKELMSLKISDRDYTSFRIPKKSGGFRDITAPRGKLKSLQRAIAELLSYCYLPDLCVKGFVPDESVVTNAGMHIDRRYILNIDIKDFFPSITYRMVKDSLVGEGVCDSVARKISRICTWTVQKDDDLPEYVLPQGSPTSPVLSNIVCGKMDRRLSGLAARFGLTYSRYADDITFSSNHSVYSKDSEFWQELYRIINGSGFSVNEEKTRLLKRGSRQEVTGIIVGKKLNVSRKWLKNLRAAIFQMEMFGYDEKERRRIKGKLAYLQMVRDYDDLYRKLLYRYINALFATPFLEQHKYSRSCNLKLSSDE